MNLIHIHDQTDTLRALFCCIIFTILFSLWVSLFSVTVFVLPAQVKSYQTEFSATFSTFIFYTPPTTTASPARRLYGTGACDAGFFLKRTITYENGRYSSDDSCSVKVCICPAGTAAVGEVCPSNGDSFCTKCDLGYTLVNKTFCDSTNKCTCNNGVKAAGVTCTNDGDETCVSCETGYELDLSSDSCSRNYIDLTWGKTQYVTENRIIGYTDVTLNMDVDFEFTAGLDGINNGWQNVISIGNSDKFRQPSMFFEPNSYDSSISWNQAEEWRQVGFGIDGDLFDNVIENVQ